jgi:hypothetical protein
MSSKHGSDGSEALQLVASCDNTQPIFLGLVLRDRRVQVTRRVGATGSRARVCERTAVRTAPGQA